MKPVTILTAGLDPLPHEQAMAGAIATLAPDRPCRFEPGRSYSLNPETDVCPLTLTVPALDLPALDLPALDNALFQQCADVAGLRDRVRQEWSIPHCNSGDRSLPILWLPVIWTAKGPLYAEVIQDQSGTYHQPYHLKDKQRQPLYRFAFQLLDQLQATPAVYMMAIQWQEEGFAFDRLLPFPNAAAIASVEVQSPDLFACHWQCLQRQPIWDVQIWGQVD
ncbi:MAG: hypothetical protein ACPGVO_16330 [Spirulinaceae cyanobacterium]